MSEYQVVNRVDSRGRVVGHWVSDEARVNFMDRQGTVRGGVTSPLPWPDDMTFEFYVNALGGAMLDTSPFHAALPATIDLSSAFAAAGLRLPTDANGDAISGMFSLIEVTPSGWTNVKPSWWDGNPFTLNCGFDGRCQLTAGNLLHFLCDGTYSLKSVDQAWLYQYGVWGAGYLELSKALRFITYE